MKKVNYLVGPTGEIHKVRKHWTLFGPTYQFVEDSRYTRLQDDVIFSNYWEAYKCSLQRKHHPMPKYEWGLGAKWDRWHRSPNVRIITS